MDRIYTITDREEEERDDTLMTKEAFFTIIDRARAGKKIEMSIEEMEAYLGDKIARM